MSGEVEHRGVGVRETVAAGALVGGDDLGDPELRLGRFQPGGAQGRPRGVEGLFPRGVLDGGEFARQPVDVLGTVEPGPAEHQRRDPVGRPLDERFGEHAAR